MCLVKRKIEFSTCNDNGKSICGISSWSSWFGKVYVCGYPENENG